MRPYEEFHRKFGHPVRETPTRPDDAEVRFRLCFLVEELCETLEACGVNIKLARELLEERIAGARLSVVLPAFIDGLGDLKAVIDGTYLQFGVDGAACEAVILEANMRKIAGKPGAKTVKPPGWTPPDIAGELKRQGWKP